MKHLCTFFLLTLILASLPTKLWAIEEYYLFMSTNRANSGAGLTYTLAIAPTQNIDSGADITIIFPDGDDGGWCLNPGVLEVVGVSSTLIDQGGSAWEIDAALPGTLAALCNQGSGSSSYDEIVISGLDALSAGQMYGVAFAGDSGLLGTDTVVGPHNVDIVIDDGTISENSFFILQLLPANSVNVSAQVVQTDGGDTTTGGSTGSDTGSGSNAGTGDDGDTDNAGEAGDGGTSGSTDPEDTAGDDDGDGGEAGDDGTSSGDGDGTPLPGEEIGIWESLISSILKFIFTYPYIIPLVTALNSIVLLLVGIGFAGGTLLDLPYMVLRLIWGGLSFLGIRKKGDPYGFAYNGYSKEPVGYALVTLVSQSGSVVAKDLTDRNGVFRFSLDKGAYKLFVKKNGFLFPSGYVASVVDGGFNNVYHGEQFEVSEGGGHKFYSVPLDPNSKWGALITTPSVRWRSIFGAVQLVLILIGLLISLLLYSRFSEPLNFALFLIHLLGLIVVLMKLFGIGRVVTIRRS